MTPSLRARRFMRGCAGAFLLAASSSCGDSLGPADLVGNYTLTRINEGAPPQLVSATINCDLFLVGGRLELRTVDWSALSLTQSQDCTRAGGSTFITSLLYLGTFRITGSTMTFETLRSIDDTLRFVGPIAFGNVTLSVSDVARGLPGPIVLRFGPREPL